MIISHSTVPLQIYKYTDTFARPEDLIIVSVHHNGSFYTELEPRQFLRDWRDGKNTDLLIAPGYIPERDMEIFISFIDEEYPSIMSPWSYNPWVL